MANVRKSVAMDPEMKRRAFAKAADLGISFSEYVRRLVARDLGDARPKADVRRALWLRHGWPRD